VVAAALALAFLPGATLADPPRVVTSPPGPYHLSGTVTGSDGAPLANIEIWAKNMSKGGNWQATTGADGGYLLHVSSGTYLLGVWADSYLIYFGCISVIGGSLSPGCPPAAIAVDSADVSGVDFSLPVTQASLPTGIAHVSGVVRRPDGKGLAGILVKAQSQGAGFDLSEDTLTAADGSFSEEVAAPFSYNKVVVNDNGGKPSPIGGNAAYYWGCYNSADPGNFFAGGNPANCTTVTVAIGAQISGIDITLAPVLRLSGTIKGPSGAALTGIKVAAATDPNGAAIDTTSPSSNGAYSLTVPPGSYGVYAWDPSHTYVNGCYEAGAPGNFTSDQSACTLASMTTANVSGIDITMSAIPATTPTPAVTPTPTVGPATQIRVETAPDGSGTVVSAQDLTLGSSLKVYAISRDAGGNFVARVDATWGLIGRTGGVAPTDLWGPSGGAYAILFGNAAGTTAIQATRGDLTRFDSGVITIGSPTGSTLTGSTPTGTNVAVSPSMNGGGETGISLTFADVSAAGVTSVAVSNAGPSLPGDFVFAGSPIYYDVSTTAAHSGAITLCLPYDPNVYAWDQQVSLLHWNGTSWDNVTSTVDAANATVCGTVTSLSPFVVAQRRSGANPSLAGNGSASGPIIVLIAAIIVIVAAVSGLFVVRRRQGRLAGHETEAGSPEPRGDSRGN
jgi:hypothetical protein